MLYIVTGGSGSGKSEYAENLAVSQFLANHRGILYYVATMHSVDDESDRRIERHRKQRAGKGFTTLECETGLEQIKAEKEDVILLEDLSNLLANEMYLQRGRIKVRDESTGCQLEKAILFPLFQLEKQAGSIVVVANEVFSDGMEYDEETRWYVRLLGQLNQKLAEKADSVVEVVCGIPVWHKGAAIENI